jgi:hypothetical protein
LSTKDFKTVLANTGNMQLSKNGIFGMAKTFETDP